jgi:hypothetical protein
MEDEQESTRGWVQSDISRELRKKWGLLEIHPKFQIFTLSLYHIKF